MPRHLLIRMSFRNRKERKLFANGIRTPPEIPPESTADTMTLREIFIALKRMFRGEEVIGLFLS